MITNHTVESLKAFESDIAETYNAGKIKAPVHLEGGNEKQLIDIFNSIGSKDWLFVTWRSHYKCLLKGVDPSRLKADIIAGKSITLNYPEHRIVSSAIVGGIIPIALGVALSIKRNGLDDKVFAFVGDMTSHCGVFYECMSYAANHELPIGFIVEINGKSVCTDTEQVWGRTKPWWDVIYYDYELPWPHSGAGKRINF